PLTMRDGGALFACFVSDKSKGTKTFALVRKVRRTGLIEVPYGITLHEVIYNIGGGTLKDFKAVQTGGPSGGCLSEDQLDLPIDYESLQDAGSIMGSGGLIIMDAHTCMVDVAKYFLNFTSQESCGKCTPCRIGTRKMVEILVKITSGNAVMTDLDLLEVLSDTIKQGSLCGLGQTAPNPVLTTLKYFRDEYIAHIEDEHCPAAVCRDLVEYRVLSDKCTGCQRCVAVCPTGAITGPRSEPHNLDLDKCIKCRACYEICRFDAIAGDAIVIE
ncbi:MAG: 4Fe-4S binding protein, partial [Planctomycetes bacterium]|nr:4Fe-4S binding protein [Planctomycetota bacterium]